MLGGPHSRHHARVALCAARATKNSTTPHHTPPRPRPWWRASVKNAAVAPRVITYERATYKKSYERQARRQGWWEVKRGGDSKVFGSVMQANTSCCQWHTTVMPHLFHRAVSSTQFEQHVHVGWLPAECGPLHDCPKMPADPTHQALSSQFCTPTQVQWSPTPEPRTPNI